MSLYLITVSEIFYRHLIVRYTYKKLLRLDETFLKRRFKWLCYSSSGSQMQDVGLILHT